MFDSPLPCKTSSGDALRVTDLESYAKEWLLDGEIAQQSPKTLENHRLYVKNLLWFLRRQGYEHVGTQELKQFIRYFQMGHTEEGGRWGNLQEKTPVKASTKLSPVYWCKIV